MSSLPSSSSVIDSALADRRTAAASLGSITADIVDAAHAMARRFREGAVLYTVGTGANAPDAAHVTVEFVHPVIAGKRALPSLSLHPSQVARRAAGDSIVLGVTSNDDRAVTAALAEARDRGCLTVALTRSAVDADHCLSVDAADPLITREAHVSIYHVLWELVHEFLEAADTGAEEAVEGLSSLYPFLYERPEGTEDDIDDHARGSARSKSDETGDLRERMLTEHVESLVEAARAIAEGGTVWTFGNGGSCTDAQAIARLLGSDELAGTPRPATALTDDVATITALTNDVNFEVVFARQLRSLGRAGDVAIGLSTSGGSANVLAGLEAAADMGMTTIGFAGYDGGEMADLDALDRLFVVPSSSVHRIQESQTTLAHVMIELART